MSCRTETGTAPPFTMVEVGSIARRALRNGSRGQVRAAFGRSFYMALDDQWICAGAREIGSGPINALLQRNDRRHRASCAPSKGDRVGVRDGALWLNDDVFAELTRATEFSVAPPERWSVATLAAGIEMLDAKIAGVHPEIGLAVFCRSPLPHGPLPPVAALALDAATRLAELTEAELSRHPTQWRREPQQFAALVGLGPGLTPSGDDMLVGALIALHALGLRDLRHAIWSAIAPVVAIQTNQISKAHLSAAAEGQCSAALSDIVAALMCGSVRDLTPALRNITTVGHCSGWDALAGAVVVLRAYQAAPLHAHGDGLGGA